jgi:hypothetical protein
VRAGCLNVPKGKYCEFGMMERKVCFEEMFYGGFCVGVLLWRIVLFCQKEAKSHCNRILHDFSQRTLP